MQIGRVVQWNIRVASEYEPETTNGLAALVSGFNEGSRPLNRAG